MRLYKFTFVILFLLSVNIVYSQLTTPNVLSSNMVLQQGQKIPVWGTSKPNEKIQISFGKQKLKTKADTAGNWKVELTAMQANNTPQKMEIKSKNETIIYDNILIGEVWLAAGQSNMEYTMKRYKDFLPPEKGEDFASLELIKPSNEMIRVYNCSRKKAATMWEVANGKSLENTSVAGYFFVKNIQEKLNVPVGIISSAVGGTQIEAWTTSKAYEKSPVFADEIKQSGKVGGRGSGNWYEIMIAPLIPYAIKGVIWYQGENNCAARERMYAEKYKVLVNSWREAFNNTNAPFYCVLLAPHIYSDRLHKSIAVTAEELPFFWQQQLKSTSMVSNSDYIVVSDLVDKLNDIHPPYKWEVGKRLSQLALAKTYGLTNIEWSGPRFKEATIVGDSIFVSFDHCADSLKTNNSKRINWFEIASDNGIFRPALAEFIDKNKVKIYHPDIHKPLNVRFSWHETAIPNLVNSFNLPAAPFITNN